MYSIEAKHDAAEGYSSRGCQKCADEGWVDDRRRPVYYHLPPFSTLCRSLRRTAEQTGAKRVIVVEVKGFRGASTLHDFHAALGQYIAYRDLLVEIGQPFQVYLAMSQEVYRVVFGLDAVQAITRRERLLLLVGCKQEVIAQWIE